MNTFNIIRFYFAGSTRGAVYTLNGRRFATLVGGRTEELSEALLRIDLGLPLQASTVEPAPFSFEVIGADEERVIFSGYHVSERAAGLAAVAHLTAGCRVVIHEGALRVASYSA